MVTSPRPRRRGNPPLMPCARPSDVVTNQYRVALLEAAQRYAVNVRLCALCYR